MRLTPLVDELIPLDLMAVVQRALLFNERHGGVVSVAHRDGALLMELRDASHVDRVTQILAAHGVRVSDPLPPRQRFTFEIRGTFRRAVAPVNAPDFLQALLQINHQDPDHYTLVNEREAPGVVGPGELPPVRVWVDVAPEGVAYLRSVNFHMRTITRTIRWRPARESSGKPAPKPRKN